MTTAYKFTEGAGYSYGGTGGGNPATYNLTATDIGVAAITQAWYAEAITHVGFPYRSKTGTPVELTLTLETMDASGLPSGTDVGGGSPTATAFTPPNDTTWNNTFQWVALTNSYTPARGEILCVTLQATGAPDGSNYSTVAFRFDEQYGAGTLRNFPHIVYMVAGTWAKTGSSSSGGAVAFKTASHIYGAPISNTVGVINANTAGYRVAKAFTYPTTMVSTFKIIGAHIGCKPASAAGTIKWGLWNSAGTALQTGDMSTIYTRNNYSSGRPISVIFEDTTLATLSGGTRYYIGLENVDTNCSLDVVSLTSADETECFPNGENVASATWNGSSWTEDATKMPVVEIIFEEWDVPSGGSEHSYGF